jgi:hypothetical protein
MKETEQANGLLYNKTCRICVEQALWVLNRFGGAADSWEQGQRGRLEIMLDFWLKDI